MLPIQTKGDVSYLTPQWQAPDHVHAIMTLRSGGVSEESYQSLNLGDHVADSQSKVKKNREQLIDSLSLPATPRWLNQSHSTQVIELSNHNTDQSPPQADASWTREAGCICAVLTADCLPVVMTNQAGTQVAVAHAGWRGLFDGILENTLASFEDPSDVLVWMAVGIGPAQFEVGFEVVKQLVPDFSSAFVRHKDNPDKYLLNLYQIAKQRLQKRGVRSIYYDETLCTYTDSTRFFSYRRDGITGRHATLIWLQQN